MIIDEIYDVVDKDGNVLGQATWTECHTKGLLHQNVHGLVFKDKNKKTMLIKKRSSSMVQEPSLWEVAVSGHMLTGTTPEDQIRKEFGEELWGLPDIPEKIEFRKVKRFLNHDIPKNFEVIHLFEIIFPGPFKFISGESEGLPIWVNVEDLLEDMNRNPKKYAKFTINTVKNYYRD